MARKVIPIAIALAAILAVVLGWIQFVRTDSARFAAAGRVLTSRSEVHLAFTIRRDTGPIAEERYEMTNLDGLSTASYRGSNRSGLEVKVNSFPRRTYDVSFLFGQVVADGIWKLPSRPPRGDRATTYTISVAQTIDGAHGGRTFSFTDPHYWATVGGHQYKIHLEKDKPIPDLLTMESTVIVEPRYDSLVRDFLGFGSPEFRASIDDARKRLATHS
jgi:hypothetical protein